MAVTRQEIMKQAATRLLQEFQGLYTIPHSALKGKEAEKIVRQFLNEHLPKRYSCGSGFILDKKESVSRQTDLIIYDAFHCPVYRVSDDASIFPSDNVAAVIEVKSILDKKEFEDADSKLRLIKEMAKTADKYPESPVLTQTMGILFAFGSSITLDKICEHYRESFEHHGIATHIDLIVVLDKGVVSLALKPRGYGWSPGILVGIPSKGAEGNHIATAIHDIGLASLDWFWRLLLSQLAFFRGIMDHPGYDWATLSGQRKFRLQYLASITYETDPQKKQENLDRYHEEVKEEFSSMNSMSPEGT